MPAAVPRAGKALPRFSPSANPISRSHPKEMTMAEAYIVEAVRTAGARRNGALAGWHPADMAGEVLNALVDRTGIDPAAIDDVIMGCVTQAGEQANHLGRMAVLASQLPRSVPAVTIARPCGPSQSSGENTS